MKGYSFGELVKLAESMAPLSGAVFTGNVTAPKFLISTAQPSEANAATRRDWVVAELAKKLDLAGGTVTGTTTMAKVLMSVNQPSEANSFTRKDYVDTKVARYEYGVGVKQGVANDAAEYTEDKTRDFNKLLTAGEFTITGNWENGVNGRAAAESHTGIVKVEVRAFSTGPAYVQTFKASVSNSYHAKTRVGSGTYPNIVWKPWASFSPYEAWTGYRMGVSRPGPTAYPYFTLHKADKFEGVPATSGQVASEYQFKYGPPTDPQNPVTAATVGVMQAHVRGDEQTANLTFDARDLTNKQLSIMRLGCIDWNTGDTGWSVTNQSRTTKISAGVLTTDKVLLSAAQGTESNAAVRRDYLINQLGNYVPLTRTINGQSLEKDIELTPEDLGCITKAVLDAMKPVGHVLISLNPANPATYGYPGEWEKVEDDTTLISASSGIGGVTGSNSPTVPLPAHSHNVSGSTSGGGEHTHNYYAPLSGGSWFSGASTWYEANPNAVTSSNGHHSHTISGTAESAGTAGATIDVRGKRLAVYIWKRTK